MDGCSPPPGWSCRRPARSNLTLRIPGSINPIPQQGTAISVPAGAVAPDASAIAGVGTVTMSTPRFNPDLGAVYSLGLSYDSRPLSFGGWRPFSAETVHMRHTDSGDV